MTLQNLSAFVQEHITKNYPEALSLTDKAFMVNISSFVTDVITIDHTISISWLTDMTLMEQN